MVTSEMVRDVTKWRKDQLVNWLIEHGTIYPERSGLLKWPKEQLQNRVLERMSDVSL